MRGPRINRVVIHGRVEVSWSRAAVGWKTLLLCLDRRWDTDVGPVQKVSRLVIAAPVERVGREWDAAPGDWIVVEGKLGTYRRSLVVIAARLDRC